VPAGARIAGEGYAPVFWMAFTRSANPMLLADLDRRIVAANEPAAVLADRPVRELTGLLVTALLEHPDEALPDDVWRRRVLSGDWSGRRRIRRPDGSVRDVDFAMRAARIDGHMLALGVCLHEAPGAEDDSAREPAPLTARECEVLHLIALGRVSKEICEELHIAPDTVRAHVRNAMAKTGARTRAQLIAIALADGLIRVEP
jgi:DNA-binding CsgD family transcriptional regulator